jgi:hypothetical protein
VTSFNAASSVGTTSIPIAIGRALAADLPVGMVDRLPNRPANRLPQLLGRRRIGEPLALRLLRDRLRDARRVIADRALADPWAGDMDDLDRILDRDDPASPTNS